MDVWIEFKNASRWQAEALFRNFFPSAEEEEEIILEGDLDGVDLPNPPTSPSPSSTGTSSLWSVASPFTSSNSSLSSPLSSVKSALSSPPQQRGLGPDDFGSKNQAYLPPPVEEHIAASQHSAKPLDSATLGKLAKKFADSIPEEEFSVAALQGCEFCF
jgi:chaperone BCS1